MAALAFAWKFASLPAMRNEAGQAGSRVLHLLARPVVAWGMLAVSLFFMGQFTLFTYLRPFLESATHLGVSGLSLMLLIMGAAGFAGTTLIGGFLGDGLYRTLVVIPLAMAAIAVSLVAFGATKEAVMLLLAAWGLFGTSAPVGWWTWLARILPHDAEAGGGLIVAVVQLAIMLGATVGGMVFDARGYWATFYMSAGLLLAAALAAWLAGHASRAAPNP